jgi:glycerol-3-phosphate acyltransferase PlsY
LDAGKGALPVYLAVQQFPSDLTLHALVALAAFAGHVFPVWLRFKGGKGVATAAGVSAVLMPLPMLIGMIVFVALVAAFRVASIASLSSALTLSLAAVLFKCPFEYVCLSVALFLMMLFTHRANISRLLKRTENRV